MLLNLSILDFVIVDKMSLDFKPGFSALTGETGAGKSILIDALSLALGQRNEGGVVRLHQDKADISAIFDIQNNNEVINWLKENELESDNAELILRRVIHADGKSRAFINGKVSTLQQLKELGESLVDIYSQNSHHSLLKLSSQRQILDNFGGHSDLAAEVYLLYQTWHKLHIQKIEYEKNAQIYSDELAELRDKLRELKQFAFTLADWETLQQDHSMMSHGSELIENINFCIEVLEKDDTAISNRLHLVQQKISHSVAIDEKLKESSDLMDSICIQTQELIRSLNRYLQKVDLDPERLKDIEARIQAIHNFGRKHRIKPEEFEATLISWQARMNELESFQSDEGIDAKEKAALEAFNQKAELLTQARKKAAETLGSNITDAMQKLSFSHGRFEVKLTPQEPTLHGLEQIEFLAAPHLGAEARPIHKAASGGELSRLSLAIRVASISKANVPCMIFDEVDVGIGGSVAEIVGKLLKELGSHDQRQVLVITHLPQVASLAVHHYKVSKTQENNQTLSHIHLMDEKMRVDEIARMLGGISITDTTREHAKEMLQA
jgi:DNA repair protein RecN (Recombination protein N)